MSDPDSSISAGGDAPAAGAAQPTPQTAQTAPPSAPDGAVDAVGTGPPDAKSTSASTGQGAPRLSRRRVLQGAVLGAAGLGALWAVGSMRDLGRGVSRIAGATASPSSRPKTRGYRSRPDLVSPLIAVSGFGTSAGNGHIFLTPAGGPGGLIVDSRGEPVWIHNGAAGKSSINLSAGSYRGRPVVIWWEGAVLNGVGQGEYVIADTSYREIARIRGGNGFPADLHDIVITPEGTALFTAYRPRARQSVTAPPLPSHDSTIVSPPPPPPTPGASASPGPSLSFAASSGSPTPTNQLLESMVQEIDVATGRLLFEWHSADYVSPDESYRSATPDRPYDYMHLNSVDVDTDGSLLLSARHTCAIYKIDRRSGEVIWRLGGKRSDFRLGPGASFAWQHDARRLPDGSLSLFDDGSNGGDQPMEPQSRGLVLRLDEQAMTASVMREYRRPSAVRASSQGSMRVLPDGTAFVGWGDQPFYTQFSAGGEVLFDGQLPDGFSSYRAVRVGWQGKPIELPAVAVQRGTNGLTVFASWNGATDVASWQVLGGASPDALGPLATASRAGFETAIDVGVRVAYLTVRAIAADGSVLGDSGTVTV